MNPFARILFATDFSPASEKAFQSALELAKSNSADLLIAHSCSFPGLFPTDLALAPVVSDRLEQTLRDAAQQRLAALVQEAQACGVAAGQILLTGPPDLAILEAARDTSADLVVLGTHGRHGPMRLLLGSVASRVVSSADCPVLTVHAA